MKTGREWGDDVPFLSQKDVDEYAEQEGFVKNSTNRTVDGETVYYRCKSLPKSKAKLCKSMKVFKPARNIKFFVSVSVGDHNHSDVGTKSQKCPELWEYVYNLKHEDSMKPRKIKEHLKRNKPEYTTPTIRQIRHIIQSTQNKKIPSTFSYGELVEWLKTETAIPDDLDEAFVINWTFNEKNDSFAFVLSTRRLLINVADKTNLSSDGTYKILWQDFPLIVVGFLDRQKHFHVVAVVVTSNERRAEYRFVFQSIKMATERESDQIFKPNIILTDHAAAIRNGFFDVFGPSKNVICSVHMLRKIRERKYSSKENKNLILDDVRILQRSSDAQKFDRAVILFLEKWEKTENEFCTYFKSTWLGEFTRNWFTGYDEYVPDHNNGIVGIFFVSSLHSNLVKYF